MKERRRGKKSERRTLGNGQRREVIVKRMRWEKEENGRKR